MKSPITDCDELCLAWPGTAVVAWVKASLAGPWLRWRLRQLPHGAASSWCRDAGVDVPFRRILDGEMGHMQHVGDGNPVVADRLWMVGFRFRNGFGASTRHFYVVEAHDACDAFRSASRRAARPCERRARNEAVLDAGWAEAQQLMCSPLGLAGLTPVVERRLGGCLSTPAQ